MLDRVDFYDASNIPGAFDWVMGVATVVGLIFAGVQLRKSRTALEAAEAAYKRAEAEHVKVQTIRDVTLLGQALEQLIRGAEQTDRDLASAHLGTFVDIGGRVIAQLSMSSPDAGVAEQLENVLDLASQARHDLYQAPLPTTTNLEQIGPTIRTMQQTVTQLNTWTTALALSTSARS